MRYYSSMYDLTPDEYDYNVFEPEKDEDMLEDTREDPTMDVPEWIPANNVGMNWIDCSIGIECFCGYSELVVNGENDLVTCPKCGRAYRLNWGIEVTNYGDYD